MKKTTALLICLSIAVTVIGAMLQTKSVQAQSTAVCTADVKLCPNGGYVSRDATNNCNFYSCDTAVAPSTNPNATPPGERCATDSKLCADGTLLYRQPANNCQFASCPILVCTTDIKTCPDGTTEVSRNPSLNCDFNQCPAVVTPSVSPSSSPVSSVTPGGAICTADVKKCSDGSYVARNPFQNCQFSACPGEVEVSPSPGPTCDTSADFDANGRVDILDYSTLAADFFSSGPNLQTDLNCDLLVDLIDYTLFVQSFSLL